MTQLMIDGRHWGRFRDQFRGRNWLLAVAMLVMTGFVPLAAADEIAALTQDGQRYAVPLPDGYCDISATPVGIALRGYMDDLAQTNKMMPKPGIIFQHCEAEKIFPWGYVGTLDGRPVIATQDALNRLRAKLYGQAELMQDILGAAGDINADAMSEWGIDVGKITAGTPTIILSDAHAIVSVMISEALVDGMPYSEKLISSGSVLDGLIFEFVIFDDKGAGGIDTMATARLLVRNARALKAANDNAGMASQATGKDS